MKRLTKNQIDLRTAQLAWDARTWGELEAVAGIEDRDAFWTGKDETQARDAIHDMIRQRVERGEL